jgi:hypothetical protein
MGFDAYSFCDECDREEDYCICEEDEDDEIPF